MPDLQTTKVAILGGGRGGTALLDLLSQIPGIEILGIADKDPNAPGIKRGRDLNLQVTNDVGDLIKRPGLNLIVDVTGDSGMERVLAAQKARGVEVLGGEAAKLLWNLVQHEARLQAQLFQAEKLAGIGSFAAGIAHDINNPLYVILGFAETIMEERDSAIMREHAERILQAAQQTSALCRDLTRYARRSTTDDLVNVELNAKLDEALKIARYCTILQDLAVVKEYASKPIVTADPDQMLHSFVNLMTNAIHAMDGKGTLTLGTSCLHGVARVTISDTGCGIPKEHLEKIFDPFFTTKAPGKGTGLGLYNVKSIVRRFHGRLLVESEVGKGTTFRLEFPATGQA
jgi:signal transduction histidine kinase